MRIKLRKHLAWDRFEPAFKLLLLIMGILVIYLALDNNLFFQNHLNSLGGAERWFLKVLFIISMLVFLSSLVFRTFLWFRYKPFDSEKVTQWPEVTVIVPAYNEGEVIFQTIDSIARCDYPAGKMKITAINDGSTDATLSYIKAAKAKYPELVEIIDFPRNRGKRRAIYTAFKRSRAPYFVTIDSDTRLDSNAIKEIVTPMVLDSKIAAVTGRIRVWNKEKNLLTRMMNAHFAMAFDFTRAIQSTFSCVFCLAGAFSAYRASALRGVIDRWLKQTFLKINCTYGEDRSLTNHLLREGHGTFFQRAAVSHTIVPEKLGKILKMFTRWARSNIRESIIFSKLLFNSRRKGNVLYPFIEFFSSISLLLLHIIWFYYFLFSGMFDGNYLVRILSYSILFGFFYILYYIRIEGRKDSPYIILFSLFSSVFMIWIFTVAGFTLTKTSWSTR